MLITILGHRKSRQSRQCSCGEAVLFPRDKTALSPRGNAALFLRVVSSVRDETALSLPNETALSPRALIAWRGCAENVLSQRGKVTLSPRGEALSPRGESRNQYMMLDGS